MNIAYAANGSAGEGWGALVPLFLMGCIVGSLLRSIAKRKDRSQWLWFLAGFIPGWNLFAGLWLASLPDKAIFEEVRALIEELRKFDLAPKGAQTGSAPAEPQSWKCNCGITNDMNLSNCPQCGLKKDYLLKRSTEA